MSRKFYPVSAVFASLLLTTALTGCSSDTKEGAVVATKVNESTCYASACHGDQRSQVTGVAITDEFRNSKHFQTAGVGCQDCHGGGSLHHGKGPIPYPNPDSAGICVNCHTSAILGSPHFNNLTSVATPDGVRYPAAFINDRNTNNCRNCHNPHSTAKTINGQAIYADYAKSAHGDVNGEGWIHYKWKNPDRASCQRCHTTTGLIANLNGTTATFFGGNNQVLDCGGCHTNYNFSTANLRSVGAVTNPGFTNVTSIHFPDAGESNICLKCHVGREAGESIKQSKAFKNFTGTTSFINSHYLTAGGVVYAKTGYEFAGRDYTDFGAHKNADSVTTVGEGACVACHMNTSTSHKFLPVTKDTNGVVTAVVSNACAFCHGVGSPTPAFLEGEKAGLAAATEALKAGLATQSIFFANTNPYFFKTATSTARSNAVTKWAKFSPADNNTGRNTMGAAFNLNMVLHDPGAYAHNKVYVQRLIYDSIDWINDGVLNDDVVATINASTLTAQQKTDAIAYLNGGVRP